MQLYTIQHKQSRKFLGVKMTITDTGNVLYTFSEDNPHLLYVHLSKAFIERAIAANEAYDGSFLHPFWGTLAPENYEIVTYEPVEK